MSALPLGNHSQPKETAYAMPTMRAFRVPVAGCSQSRPNQSLQQTAGACRLSGIHSSFRPRRC